MSWRYPIALILISVPLLIFAPAAGAAPITVTCNGGGCSGGWYKTSVTVAFAWDATGAGKTNGCGTATVTADTTNWSQTCVVHYVNGSQSELSVTIRKDASPPAVTGASAGRDPDSNGWYNHPVPITFTGSDGVSGIASCTSVTYAGPDSSSASVSGACTDQAGNVSGSTSFSLKYDATPPTISNVNAEPDDGAAILTWSSSSDVKAIEIDRTPGSNGGAASVVFKGLASRFEDRGLKNNAKYAYTVTAFDEAGNKASQSVTIVPGAKLYSPARGANVTSPPLLAWRPVAGATYYNLQLYYGVGSALRRVASLGVSGKKVLSTWPRQPKYRLAKAWKFNGKARKLNRGHYRWYVYPGIGKRTANKYGPLIGSSDFFVTKR
jgi:LysM repeat protein